jgi:Flp pilus assembly protein TadD
MNHGLSQRRRRIWALRRHSTIFCSLIHVAVPLLCGLNMKACIWDAVTLKQEQGRRPNLAQAVEGRQNQVNNITELRVKIQKLEDSPQDSAEWLNDLAGSYLRIGEPRRAVTLLEPAVSRFATNYGLHANLGTAYHLLGDYRAAEREIAKDLEINPQAHFGLERYHLALLQYLVRDLKYQQDHVYLDEWSEAFTQDSAVWMSHYVNRSTGLFSHERARSAPSPDTPPGYLAKWDLASDPKFEEGVAYMATLNARQPACFTMLGVACLARRDFNLASAAFHKAIDLGSPQRKLLEQKIGECEEMISHSRSAKFSWIAILILVLSFAAMIGVSVFGLRKLIRYASSRTTP